MAPKQTTLDEALQVLQFATTGHKSTKDITKNDILFARSLIGLGPDDDFAEGYTVAES